MATYACEGVIIRRQNFGEADRLVTFFSDRYGKIRAVAKGARRPAAKMAGTLELFFNVKLRLAEGKNLDIIVESNPVAVWRSIREDLAKMQLASYLGEIVDKTTQENQTHPGVYRLLIESFEYINVAGLSAQAGYVASNVASDFFRLRIMKELGYEPSVERCAVSHEKLEAGLNYWSSSSGGVVCSDHAKQAERAVQIEDNTVKMMRLMLNRDLRQTAQIEAPEKIKTQTHRIINDFFEYHFDINLKSKKYVELA